MKSNYLFKVSLIPANVWDKKLKPIYVVQADKDAAIRYAEKHLRDGVTIKWVTKLAEQYGGSMFGNPS